MKMATKKPVAKKTTPAKKTAPVKKPVAKKPVAKKPAEPKAAKVNFKGLSPKDIATAKGEPYVAILSVDLDPENVGNGAFELDWNDKFIAQLVRSGYQAQPNEAEDIIVDRWFQTVCRNIVMENYEQWEANQPAGERLREVVRKDLGDGRTEIS
jgi:hypothetical protein